MPARPLARFAHLFDADEMESRRTAASPAGRMPPGQPHPGSGRTSGDRQAGRAGQAGRSARDIQPRPVSLGREQLGQQEASYPSEYVRVLAWIPFTDGTHKRCEALAIAWTRQAVKVTWRTGEEEAVEHQAWVWAAAITRQPLPGVHITDDPRTVAYRPPQQPASPRQPPEPFRPSVRAPRTRPW